MAKFSNISTWHSEIGKSEGVAWKAIMTGHIFDLVTAQRDRQEFWILVQNSLGESFCLLWSHLFGSRSDDLHYSNLCSKAEIAIGKNYSANSVKTRMLEGAGLGESDFAELWKEVKECRDKFIAHREVNASVVFPHVDQCIAVLESFREQLGEISKAMLIKEPDNAPLEGLCAYFRANTNDILRRKASHAFQIGIRESLKWKSQI